MDPTQIVQDAKVLLDEIDSEQLYANPWDVSDASVFLNYCCPQCDHKSRSLESFADHAVQIHPKARQSLFYKKVPRNKNENTSEILGQAIIEAEIKNDFDDSEDFILPGIDLIHVKEKTIF